MLSFLNLPFIICTAELHSGSSGVRGRDPVGFFCLKSEHKNKQKNERRITKIRTQKPHVKACTNDYNSYKLHLQE